MMLFYEVLFKNLLFRGRGGKRAVAWILSLVLALRLLNLLDFVVVSKIKCRETHSVEVAWSITRLWLEYMRLNANNN